MQTLIELILAKLLKIKLFKSVCFHKVFSFESCTCVSHYWHAVSESTFTIQNTLAHTRAANCSHVRQVLKCNRQIALVCHQCQMPLCVSFAIKNKQFKMGQRNFAPRTHEEFGHLWAKYKTSLIFIIHVAHKSNFLTRVVTNEILLIRKMASDV